MIRALDKRCETVAYMRGYAYLEKTQQTVELWGSRAGGYIENFEVEWVNPNPASRVEHPQPAPVANAPKKRPGLMKLVAAICLIYAIAQLAVILALAINEVVIWLTR